MRSGEKRGKGGATSASEMMRMMAMMMVMMMMTMIILIKVATVIKQYLDTSSIEECGEIWNNGLTNTTDNSLCLRSTIYFSERKTFPMGET